MLFQLPIRSGIVTLSPPLKSNHPIYGIHQLVKRVLLLAGQLELRLLLLVQIVCPHDVTQQLIPIQRVLPERRLVHKAVKWLLRLTSATLATLATLATFATVANLARPYPAALPRIPNFS